MRQGIGKIANRHYTPPHQPFFAITKRSMRRMEDKQRLRGGSQHSLHPYISLYEESQMEALQDFTTGNSLDLGLKDFHPPLP